MGIQTDKLYKLIRVASSCSKQSISGWEVDGRGELSPGLRAVPRIWYHSEITTLNATLLQPQVLDHLVHHTTVSTTHVVSWMRTGRGVIRVHFN